MKGGYSVVGHKHARANSKELGDFDPDKPESTIIDVDANNQYGKSVCLRFYNLLF